MVEANAHFVWGEDNWKTAKEGAARDSVIGIPGTTKSQSCDLATHLVATWGRERGKGEGSERKRIRDDIEVASTGRFQGKSRG